MKLNIAGLSASDVLRMSEAEARERGLVEPGREFVRDRYWWTTRLSLLNCYAKFYPMDELPAEYKVTKNKPKPPLFTYGIPTNIDKLSTYGCKHESKRPNLAILATEYTLVAVLYTNYNIDERRLVQEDEEDVIAMVKEALELNEDVRLIWDFERRDPFVPKLGQD